MKKTYNQMQSAPDNTVPIFVGQILDLKFTIRDQNGSTVDLTGATLKEILFKRVGGPTTSETAGFITDGSDGGITFTTAQTTFNAAGDWRIQAKVEMNSKLYFSNIITFQVSPVL